MTSVKNPSLEPFDLVNYNIWPGLKYFSGVGGGRVLECMEVAQCWVFLGDTDLIFAWWASFFQCRSPCQSVTHPTFFLEVSAVINQNDPPRSALLCITLDYLTCCMGGCLEKMFQKLCGRCWSIN